MRSPEEAPSARGERRLAAGPLTARWEAETGTLRHLAWHGVEFLRAVYANVRRADWSTSTPTLSGIEREDGDERFRIAFAADHTADGVPFRWRGEIVGEATGVLTYELVGEASATFETNRTGLCVLHPGALAGRRVEARHPDARCESATFPPLVSPNVLFTDVSGLVFEPYDGCEVEIAFEGDLFETEDQRNWSDDSYKTYVYPQTRPLPYAIVPGREVRQKATVTLRGEAPARANPSPVVVATPNLGALVTGPDATDAKVLGLTHLAAIPAGFAAARATRLPVTLLTEDPALGAGLRTGEPLALHPPRSERRKEAAHRPLLAAAPDEFTALNRARPEPGGDGTMWGVSTQVHLSDDRTPFENVRTWRDQVRTARSFADGRCVLGPIRLRSGSVDPRWDSPFGLAWTLAALAGAARSEADLVVLEELDRFRGKLPRLALLDVRGAEFVGVEGSLDFELCVLHLRVGAVHRTLAANLTDEEVPLRLPPHAPVRTARVLDALNVESVAGALAAGDDEAWERVPPTGIPPRLRAYGYCRVDA